MKLNRVLALLLALSMSATLVACGGGNTSKTPEESTPPTASGEETTPASGGEEKPSDSSDEAVVINVGVQTAFAVTGLEFSRVNLSNSSWTMAPMVCDQMFYIDTTGTPKTDIFESYEYSEDHLTLTLKLKDNVYFSNGDQMVGEDILYSISRAQAGSGATWYTCINVDESTVSEDGLTINLVYNYEYGPGVAKLDICVMNKSFYESLGDLSTVDWYDVNNVCGSGPYEIVEYVQDSHAVLKLREDRWNTEREYTVDQFNITGYTDPTTMFIDFETGALDLAINISNSDATRLMNGEVQNGALGLIESNCVVVLQFNENNAYLADPVVREAICWAIPTDELTEMVAGVYGEPAGSTAGRALACYLDGCSYEYDVEYAKQLLADAGYASGEIQLLMVTTNAKEETRFAEAIQAYLNEIGITVEVQSYDVPTALPMLQKGESDLMRYTSSDGIPDLEPYSAFSVYQYNSAFSTAAKSDEAFNELLNEGYQNLDETVRTNAYHQVQQWLYDNYWCVPCYEWKGGYAYNPDKFEDITIMSVKRHDLTQIVAAQ